MYHTSASEATLPKRDLFAGRLATRGIVGPIALVVVLLSPQLLPGWASMLVNCAAIFLALKHWTWLAARHATRDATWRDRILFYLLWPGFDADAFLIGSKNANPRPALHEWFAAIAKTTLAGIFLWLLLPVIGNANAMVLGIAGMLGGVLLIHCGLFHVVALAWQSAGRPVTPIMNRPLAATSLVDFWSRRWNLAFRDAVALVLFRPLARRFTAGVATMLTFFASGLWHEAVISFPARGGYGLPTLYFLIQGASVCLQRRYLRATTAPFSTWVGRVTTALVVALPLPLLFPHTFAVNVLIPFLRVLRVL
jgi:Membrane bound O-acyl transferase family